MSTIPEGIKAADIRAWAIVNGFPGCEGRPGRLPAAVIVAYLDAHAPGPQGAA